MITKALRNSINYFARELGGKDFICHSGWGRSVVGQVHGRMVNCTCWVGGSERV